MIAGGIVVGHQVRAVVKDAQRKQQAISADMHDKRGGNVRRGVKTAVDGKFLQRLRLILSMCVQGWGIRIIEDCWG